MTFDNRSADDHEKDELFVYKVCTWLFAIAGPLGVGIILAALLSGCSCAIGGKLDFPEDRRTGPLAGIDDFGGIGR